MHSVNNPFFTRYCSWSFIFRFPVHICLDVFRVRYCVNIFPDKARSVFISCNVFSPVKPPDFFHLTARATSKESNRGHVLVSGRSKQTCGRSKVTCGGRDLWGRFPVPAGPGFSWKKCKEKKKKSKRAVGALSRQLGSIFSGFLCCNTICHI